MGPSEEFSLLEQENGHMSRRENGMHLIESKGGNSSKGNSSPAKITRKVGLIGDVPSKKNVECELKKLMFQNPGKCMEDYVPEKSGREMRKTRRKCYREPCRKNQMLYDESGVSLETSQDLCDCLDVYCPGCHFPCQKCGSEKCGTECRCNRKWTFDQVHVEGTNIVWKWPS